MIKKIVFHLARIIAAFVMLQTLYFKFGGAPESVYIFTKIGMEPWGRIGVGFLELITSVSLFIPSLIWFGGLMSVGLMFGAIFLHIAILGIEVQGDGGLLFIMAITVMICGIIISIYQKPKIVQFLNRMRS